MSKGKELRSTVVAVVTENPGVTKLERDRLGSSSYLQRRLGRSERASSREKIPSVGRLRRWEWRQAGLLWHRLPVYREDPRDLPLKASWNWKQAERAVLEEAAAGE